jgi:hypothetical protein
MLMLVAEMVD